LLCKGTVDFVVGWRDLITSTMAAAIVEAQRVAGSNLPERASGRLVRFEITQEGSELLHAALPPQGGGHGLAHGRRKFGVRAHVEVVKLDAAIEVASDDRTPALR